MEAKRKWPLEVLPPEKQTEQHKREIRFLEIATQNGYTAYMQASDYQVEADNGRTVLLIHRGANRRWEAVLTFREDKIASAVFGDFNFAAEAVLLWLRGEDATKSLAVQSSLKSAI